MPQRHTFVSVQDFVHFLRAFGPYFLLGHNFKFDLNMLVFHGCPVELLLPFWVADTMLEAATCLEKIPQDWLEKYEAKRKKLNEDLPRGKTHRKAERHSLKTLAPFFLKVPAFWEDPTDHSSERYVLQDCEYTYRLHYELCQRLRRQGLEGFYQKKLLPWTKMLFQAERRGIQLDMDLLQRLRVEADIEASRLGSEINTVWADVFDSYRRLQAGQLIAAGHERAERAFNRLKKPTEERRIEINQREEKKVQASIEALPRTMNLDSPTQLTWILRDHFGLDITTFDDDESTGKEVLQRLSALGRADISLLLQYRQTRKLHTSFFPTYMDLATTTGTLHTSFNSAGPRTGRLSSSSPNLQQVPGELHRLFVARPGYKLITRDLSGIEPCIVAYYTSDPILCHTLVSGGDFHSKNAIIMFDLPCLESEVKEKYPNERRLAKTVGLALMYGAGPGRIQAAAQQVGFVWSTDKCQDIFDNFQNAYREVFAFKFELDERLRRGEAIPNLLGRKHSYANKRDIHMKGFNTLVQGSASDLLLHSTSKAKIEMDDLQLEAHPLLWVHDESVFEALEAHAPHVEEILERHLTCHKLPTRYGDIPLRCEGHTEYFWSK